MLAAGDCGDRLAGRQIALQLIGRDTQGAGDSSEDRAAGAGERLDLGGAWGGRTLAKLAEVVAWGRGELVELLFDLRLLVRCNLAVLHHLIEYGDQGIVIGGLERLRA